MAVQTWHSLLLYSHIEAALSAVRADAVRFKDEIGAVQGEVSSQGAHPVPRGTLLTLVPRCQGVTFNPQQTTFTCDLDELVSAIAPRAYLLTAGETDPLFPIDGVGALVEQAGK